MIWTHGTEQHVYRLFEMAFGSRDKETVKVCVMGLRDIGLSEDQIRNGFMAGTMQMALDTGKADIIRDAFIEFANKRPEDAKVVLKSLID